VCHQAQKCCKIFSPNGNLTDGYIDFYKADHFLIEAKQGSDRAGKGTAKRGTNSYLKAMEKAFVQAVAYTRHLSSKPPFVLTCDIGERFELWQGFSGDYGGYGARQDILFTDLRKPEVFALFVDIFTDPQLRNPEKIAAKVTREVAADLAELSKRLEGQHDPQAVAHFLMRCIFTMFAEDVGLLKEHLFTEALESRWLTHPKTFQPEVTALWEAMNDGTAFGFYGRLLKFNGGLFAEAIAFELTADQLEVLLRAAKREWRDVEPAIFGTLLERALDVKERSKLGAHYTPRSYVERLVRPVVLEPLREQWDLVQGEVLLLLGEAETEPTAAQKKKAVTVLEAFLTELQGVRVLDPACGSGNFLYVTLDLMKQLESEVLRRLSDVAGNDQLRMDLAQVNPSQFLGIELNPRAAAIADLVIWIGYLQWHFRRFGDIPPIEPVLREYKNIECRDAVLAYDSKEPDVDAQTGKLRTRWGGRMMKHPVTGEDVPDPSDQLPIWKYINAREAEWQEADYILGNPPFIGNKRMRETLGDGYTEALRRIYKDIPDSVDYVMYWWFFASRLLTNEKIQRFGFITTNSINQTFNLKVIQNALNDGISLTFAIPDHPWVDGVDGAAVRVAMTQAEKQANKLGQMLTVQEIPISPEELETSEKIVFKKELGIINASLNLGVDASNLIKLRSNKGVVFQGVIPIGDGFKLTEEDLKHFGYSSASLPSVIKPYVIGMDIVRVPKKKWIIDFFGFSESQIAEQYPYLYQHIHETVRPVRLQNREASRRKNWWLFARSNEDLRAAIQPLARFVATPDTSKFKPFTFVNAATLPDAQAYCIAIDDAWILGVLQSMIHQSWLEKVAPRMGKGNDLRWKPAVVFDPFPFPDRTPTQDQKIRELSDRLDSHRKRVQAQHPEITITAMYNLLEKIRAGEPLTDKDREFNNKALVSTLKQIHDELDAAVFEAYGWEDLNNESGKPKAEVDELILERLVRLCLATEQKTTLRLKALSDVGFSPRF